MKTMASTWVFLATTAFFFSTHFMLFAVRIGILTKTQILPTVLILVDFVCAIVYATQFDLRKAIYWIAAGILTITVTF